MSDETEAVDPADALAAERDQIQIEVAEIAATPPDDLPDEERGRKLESLEMRSALVDRELYRLAGGAA